MRAIVLSGGGNMGPVQVGALKALLERGLVPQMIVGCSAGALNAGFLARDVSLEQVKRLAEVWRSVTTQQIYPGSRLSATWRLLTGKDSLYDNRNFYAFLQRHGATPAQTFGTLPTKLFITATHLHSGRLHVFGDNVHERVLDAMMASTALTPMHPPWEVNGERYIDGGTVTPLPLRVAMERGATEIYAFHILDVDPERVDQRLIRGVAGVLNHSVGTMLRAQAQHDLLLAEVKSRAKLHYIPLMVNLRPDATDFSQAQGLIDEGYQITVEHFDRLKRNRRATGEEQPFHQRIAEQVTRLWPSRPIQEPVRVKVDIVRK
ncbi:MAG: patatin-like phospholipase family protein [Caldilineaceae bacterium]